MSAYGTNQGLTDYAAARGITLPSSNSTILAAGRERGSLALDALYEIRYVGTRPAGQELSWPRDDATWPDGTAVTGIPDAVVRASYEAAIQELRKPESMLPIVTPGKVKTRARVEGAVDVTYKTGDDVVGSQIPVLTAIDGILWGLISTRTVLPGVLVV